MSKRTSSAPAERVRLGEVVMRIVDKRLDPVADGLTRFVGVDDIDPDDLTLHRWGEVEDGGLPPTFRYVFPKGAVLFPTRRPALRKCAEAPFDGITGEKILVLQPKDEERLTAAFARFLLASPRLRQWVIDRAIGSVTPHFRWRDLAEFEFALPSLEEQWRVAAALQAIESALDCLARLKEVARQLWEAVSAQEFATPPPGSDSRLGDYYTRETIQVASQDASVFDLPLITPEHIAKGTGEMLDGYTSRAQDALSSKFRFSSGTVLYSRIRPNFQKVVIAESKGVCSTEIYPLIPSDEIAAEYLLEILLSATFTRFALSGTKGTGFPRVTHDHIAKFPVKVPTLADQHEYLAAATPLRRLDSVLSHRMADLRNVKTAIMRSMDPL
jgi:type I restriction enzyme S subunit